MKLGNIYVNNKAACIMAVGLAAGIYVSQNDLSDLVSGSVGDLKSSSRIEYVDREKIIEKHIPLEENSVLNYVVNNYSTLSDGKKNQLESYVLDQVDPKVKWHSMNDDSKIYFVQHGYRDLAIQDQRRALHVLLTPVIKSKISHVFDKVKGICCYGVKRLEDELQDEDPVRYKANHSTLQTFIGEGDE